MVRSSISGEVLYFHNISADLEDKNVLEFVDKALKFRPQCILLEQPTKHTTTTFKLCMYYSSLVSLG